MATRIPRTSARSCVPRLTGETVRIELDWFVRRDGTFVPVSYASAPLETPEGRGAVVVFRDVSERLAAEAIAGSRARIVAAGDAERRRIGRDLHDGAQQRLVRVLMGIEQARRDPSRAEGALADAATAARRALDDLRDLAAGLHPLVLTDRGLAVALEDLTAGAPIPVLLDVTDARFAPEIEAAAYFIVAEALTNAAKHAEASAVEVTIARVGSELRIEVADDGRGGADPARGTGLRGLEDRVAVLDGSLELAPTPRAARRCARACRYDDARSSASTASTRRCSLRSCPRSSLEKIDVTCFSTAGGPTCSRSAMP